MQKVFIGRKYVGSITLPDTKEAKQLFHRIQKMYTSRESLSIRTLFSATHLAKLKSYQKGGAREELENLEMYIDLGKIMGFATADAKQLKNSIELVNDTAHTHFNITKRVTLINKKQKSKTEKNYLFSTSKTSQITHLYLTI